MKLIINRLNNRGTTLVELIISLAILTIILSVAFSFFLFNHNLFTRGGKLSEVQFDVRMAADYITSEIRNVSEISLIDNTLGDTINLAAVSAKYPHVKSVSFEIKYQQPYYLVAYTIQGSDSDNENSYQLESEILLNNITNATSNTGTTIYYKK